MIGRLTSALYRHSSRRYRFLLVFAVNLLIAMTVGLLVLYLSASNQLSHLMADERSYLDHSRVLIDREMRALSNDLLTLSHDERIRLFAANPEQESQPVVGDILANRLRYSPDYQQLRFFNAEGHEVIRVGRSGDRIVTFDGAALREGASHPYVRHAMQIAEGSVYVSRLDLSVEDGTIKRPFRPLIRLATPIYEGERGVQGVLVLSYSATQMMTTLEELLSRQEGSPLLLDGEGRWLYSRDHIQWWESLLGADQRFSLDNPEVWSTMQVDGSGEVRGDDGVLMYRAIAPFPAMGPDREAVSEPEERWFLVSRIQPERLLLERMAAMASSGLGLLLALVSVLACALVARLRITQIEGLDALRKSEEHARGLLEGAPDAILLLDAELNCVEANQQACHLFGQPREALVGHSMRQMVGGLERAFHGGGSGRDNGVVGHVSEVIIENPDGRKIPVEVSSRFLTDGYWQGFLRDVSDRKESERGRLRAEAVFLNTSEGIIITNSQGSILDVNPAFLDISGYTRSELIGQNPSIQQSGRHGRDFYRNLWQSLEQTGSWIGEIWNRRKNGEVYAAWENIACVRDEEGRVENYIAIISDISTLKEAESKLVQLANEDSLTGLLNRRAFGGALEHAIDRAQRHGYPLALLYLDLDRFKLINDTLGHEVGDRLLQKVAQIIRDCVRSEDVVARLGGDEFTVLAENIASPEDAAVIAQALSRALENPVMLEGQEFVIPASIGIALYPRDAVSTSELARAADTAMYRAKSKGRSTYEFYTSEMTNQAVIRFETEAALRQALINQELELHYQPQWALDGVSVIGVEALIRWQHPERGLLAPGGFIPVAEESNLINEIGSWVIEEACRQFAEWMSQGLPPIKLAINLSGRQLIYGNVPEVFRTSLARYGGVVPASAFEFEVTETILQSGSKAVAELQELQEMGAEIAIDDFGKGYSSLGHLSQLPVDTLKIDQGFVKGLPDHDTNVAIVRAVISMAHSMGLKVIAEGVEEPGQLLFLQSLNCDFGQGYLFCKPVVAAEIYELVMASRIEIPFQ